MSAGASFVNCQLFPFTLFVPLLCAVQHMGTALGMLPKSPNVLQHRKHRAGARERWKGQHLNFGGGGGDTGYKKFLRVRSILLIQDEVPGGYGGDGLHVQKIERKRPTVRVSLSQRGSYTLRGHGNEGKRESRIKENKQIAQGMIREDKEKKTVPSQVPQGREKKERSETLING